MSEQLDAEVVAALMNELWEQVDGAVRRHGGRVDKHIGDAVMGVWGVDAAREDDVDARPRPADEDQDDADAEANAATRRR